MPIQPKHRTPEIPPKGICTLSGPVLSATELETKRPTVELALMIHSR